MKNIEEKIKNNNYVLLSFCLSLIIICLIYISQKIAPFGNNSMLDVDFYHQYGPLLNELYDRVKQGETLLYSFNTGLGIPFFRNFLNYLSSPFNIILFLFSKEKIVMVFSIIIGLKAIFASSAMSFYLKKTFNKSGMLASIFGTFYAFSGYFCAYYWNIMWLDGIVFLPIILYGINKIVNDKKPIIYIISLAVMLFTNYFIAYMICVFSVLYFIGYLLYRSNFNILEIIKKRKKEIVIFGISSILAAGLVSFAILPLYYSLSSISATTGSFPAFATQFKFSDYLFNHLSAVNRTVFMSDKLVLPNMYPGLLTLSSIILLFINRKINVKNKIIAISLLAMFYVAFNISTLDFMMHAFHVPNDLPWRYSFLYVFVLVTLGYYSFSKIKDTSVISISISFALVIIIILLASKLDFANIDDKRCIILIIITLIYYVLSIIYWYSNSKKLSFIIPIILVAIFEMFFSITTNWNIDHNINTFMSDKKIYKNLISYIKKEDNDLYRIEKTDYLTLNDGAWYDYKGVSTFTSMAYETTASSQRRLGLAGNDINSYYYRNYQNPVYNTMFNVKYILGNYIKNDYYTPIKTIDDKTAVLYKYPSSIAYAVNMDIKSAELIEYNPFLNLSNFVTLSTNVNNIFEPVLVKDTKNVTINNPSFKENSNGGFNYVIDGNNTSFDFLLDNEKKKNIYLYVGGSNVNSMYVDGEYYSITSDEYYILDLGAKTNEDVDVKINLKDSSSGYINFYAYTINDDAFKEFYNKIHSEKLNVLKYNDTYINGNINASEDKMLFTSISYDEGWSVYVDGKKTNSYKIYNSYLAFDITKGKHKITLRYYPKGMKLGILISILSLAIIFMVSIIQPNDYNKKYKKDKFTV